MTVRTDLPELADLLPTADVVDVKTATGTVSLREFVAGALGPSPWWIKALFAARFVLAKALKLDTAGLPPRPRVQPETISFTPGAPAAFFEVVRGEEDHYLLLKVTDNHLIGYLAFITDNASPTREFKVVTLVHFLRPVGRFYYAAIQPFHHLVLHSMIHSALKTYR
ncbi:DUF2867 domain-containing protein [Kribbella monticola]|uniref:DUF2867 domain-containing protein n=1 Tax=Kribbella monticola TaxID=2185285 RepID=UPI000DD41269|nr:DUF2867 domain-containing protein [Kribbella monticola]